MSGVLSHLEWQNRLLQLERRPLVCAAAVFATLVLRHVTILVNPQLTWEDGRIFLTEALARPWYDTWFSPFIGYYIVLPKMVASVFTPLTILYAPLVFSLFSLAVMAFAIALPIRRSFAPLAPLPVRAMWVAACALLPWHTETFGNITNIHWYVYYALTLYSLVDLSATPRSIRLLLPVLVLLGVFTTPNVVAIVPVLGVRMWMARHERRYQFYLHGATILCTAAMVVLVRRLGEIDVPRLDGDLAALAMFVVKGLGYKVVVQSLAGGLAARLMWHTAWYASGALIFAVTFVELVRRARRQANGDASSFVLAGTGYYVVASILLAGLTRPQYITHFVQLGNYWGADRYFVIPSFYFLLLGLLFLDRLGASARSRVLRTAVAMVLAAAVAMNFRYAPIPDYHWRQQLHAYYQRLLAYPLNAPPSTFAIVTYPGDPWILQAPLYGPDQSQRRTIRRLIQRTLP